MLTAAGLRSALVLLLSVLAAAAQEAFLEGRFSWMFRSTDLSLSVEQPDIVVTPQNQRVEFEHADPLDAPGPMNTNVQAFVAGSADLHFRTFGVAAASHGQTNPWDPENPPPAPTIIDTSAVSEIELQDRVIVFSPTERRIPGTPRS